MSRREFLLSSPLGPATKAIHLGQHEVGLDQFPVPPLVSNSAMLLNSAEEGLEMLSNVDVENFAYQRYANPTVSILETKFRSIEQCAHSMAVNSGMTACLLVFRTLLKAGDHIIVPHSIFYEIVDQLDYEVKNRGIEISIIREYETDVFETAIRKNTKMIFIEAPTNPAFLDINIRALAKLCEKYSILLVVDNTFLSPVCQKPLSLGAVITLYSITKHINGHGDVIGGMISTNDADIFKALKHNRNNTGLILDPFSAWLTIRGLRTLPLRLQKHAENALAITRMIDEEFPELEWRGVWSTNSAKSNGIDTACHTGLIALVFPSKEAGMVFVRHLRLIRIGTTFGNIESLCYHYGGFAREATIDLEQIGIPYGLVRISVGLEDVEDIKTDMRQALHIATKMSLCDQCA
ncbi:trans-sulfuration enzyme family protein [Collimonas humicola]|uniref:trans-sulfuration enzyme family protein n=1 Tax=Collimonas humicola TaxID=2825886 RepID=UPI001B8AA964|nr:PLP-dependent aspartate aminotransferase family protein [Collimonas humicola]